MWLFKVGDAMDRERVFTDQGLEIRDLEYIGSAVLET